MAKHPSNNGEFIHYDDGDRRYFTVTERCNLGCTFCPLKNRHDSTADKDRLKREPSLTEIIDTVCATGHCREVIFNGLGEPTYRLYDILKAARQLQGKNVRVVLNTNGLADRIHNRSIAPDLEDNIDEVNIAMNGHDQATYERLCRPQISNAYESVIEFMQSARDYVPTVNIVAASELPGIRLDPIREFANRMGVGFKEAPLTQPC